VSNPDAPYNIGEITAFGSATGIALEGDRAYVVGPGGPEGILTIADISNPAVPVALGTLALPDSTRSVVAAGDIAYLGGEDHLWSLDVSDPTAPSVIGSLPGWVSDITLVGDLIYTTDPFRVIDVSDPANPVEIAATSPPVEFGDAVTVENGLAYSGGFDQRLRVVDVSDPAAPFQLAGIDMPDYVQDIAVANGLVYVASYQSGLRIIDLGPQYVPEPQAWMMLASGAAMLGLLDRRKRRPRV
jgi:hypothetical protein